MAIAGLEFTPGYIVTTDSSGNKTSHDIKSMLRALDIPTGLTYSQVGAITTLANLVVVLVKALIAKQVLDESIGEEYDLEAIISTIEDMGGDYGEPDLNVT